MLFMMRCCNTTQDAPPALPGAGQGAPRTSLSGERGMYMMTLLHLPGSVSSGNWQSGLPSGGGSLSWNSDTCCMRQQRHCTLFASTGQLGRSAAVLL